MPEHRDGRRWLYSFRDLLALRTVVFLREERSLQKIRQAIQTLDDIGDKEHLSAYVLVPTDDGSIGWIDRDQSSFVDLVKKPGSLREPVVMEQVFGPFRDKDGLLVRPLYEPFPMIRVSPDVRGGYPVIKGTRVPYNAVSGLVQDGVPPRKVRQFYPSVSASGARDAEKFADYVEARTSSRTAA